MGAKIKLKSKLGRTVATQLDIVLPDDITMGACVDRPELLVEALALCDGDMEMFCRLFTTRSVVPLMSVAVKALRILNRQGNESFKKEFNELLRAYREAKWMMAQRKAFDFIADFNPQPAIKGNAGTSKASLSQVTSFMKFWLSGPMASEVASHKKKDDNADSDMVGNILDHLHED